MPRPKLIDRPVPIEIQVPESLASRVKLELFSDLENRVPHGEMSKLVCRLLTDWLRTERGIS